jgi:hypothetical protein
MHHGNQFLTKVYESALRGHLERSNTPVLRSRNAKRERETLGSRGGKKRRYTSSVGYAATFP